MKICIVGTSNSVLGRKGFIKALEQEHDVLNLSVGRVPFYMHIKSILENREVVEASDLVIIDHLSNHGFLQCEKYDEYLVDFYDFLSSLNVHLMVLCFPHQGDKNDTPLRTHRERSESLAASRNITFIWLKNDFFHPSNFIDPQHINHYISFLIGEWLSKDLTLSPCKPKNGWFQGYEVLYPPKYNGEFRNSLLSRYYYEINDEEDLCFTTDSYEVISIEYVSNGLCKFLINDIPYHVDDDHGVFHDSFDNIIDIDGRVVLKNYSGNDSLPVIDRGKLSLSSSSQLKFVAFLLKGDIRYFPSSDRVAFELNLSKLKDRIKFYNENGNDNVGVGAQNFVDILRESALLLESNDISLSYKLVKKALAIRPNGSFLKKKIQQYEKTLNNKP